MDLKIRYCDKILAKYRKKIPGQTAISQIARRTILATSMLFTNFAVAEQVNNDHCKTAPEICAFFESAASLEPPEGLTLYQPIQLAELKLSELVHAPNSQHFTLHNPLENFEFNDPEQAELITLVNVSALYGSQFGSNSAFYEYDGKALSVGKVTFETGLQFKQIKAILALGYLGVRNFSNLESVTANAFIQLQAGVKDFQVGALYNPALDNSKVYFGFNSDLIGFTWFQKHGIKSDRSLNGLSLQSNSLNQLLQFVDLEAMIGRDHNALDVFDLQIQSNLPDMLSFEVAQGTQLDFAIKANATHTNQGFNTMLGLYCSINKKNTY